MKTNLLLHSKDQVGKATFKMNETLPHITVSLVMVPLVKDTIRMGISDMDALGLLISDHQSFLL